MSIISCPNCKGEVSDQAVQCPHCEYPIRKYIKKSKSKGYRKIGIRKKLIPIENVLHSPILPVMGIIGFIQFIIEIYLISYRFIEIANSNFSWLVIHLLLLFWFLAVVIECFGVYSSTGEDKEMSPSTMVLGYFCSLCHIIIIVMVAVFWVLEGLDISIFNFLKPNFLNAFSFSVFESELELKSFLFSLAVIALWFILWFEMANVRKQIGSELESGDMERIPAVFIAILLFLFSIPTFILSLGMYTFSGLVSVLFSFFDIAHFGVYPFLVGCVFVLMSVNFVLGGAYMIRLRRLNESC